MTQREAIIAALKARGETQVEDRSLSRWWKFTRTFAVRRREPDGQLCAVQPGSFYFVSRSMGAVRIGTNSTSSLALTKEQTRVLINEGNDVLQSKGLS